MEENNGDVSCIFCVILLVTLVAFYWFTCCVIVDIIYCTVLFIIDISNSIVRLFEKVNNYFVDK